MIWLTLQLISCAFLTGLIWTIQVLQYPTFRYVCEHQFQMFHGFHTHNITFVVLPMMILELVTGAALVLLAPESVMLWINLSGVVLIWLSTFFVSVPLHQLLSKEGNRRTIERLISTNWFRTVLWSVRLCLLFYMFIEKLEGFSKGWT